MKVSGLCLLLLSGSLLAARAQVTVQVTQDQLQFLQGETLPAAVRITNLSGQTLHLGAGSDWLVFFVEMRDGPIVAKLGEVPVAGEFDLESSKVAIKHVNLAPYFSITEPGHYDVIATVRIPQWGREITSAPQYFDIIDGAKLWEQEVGVPKKPGAPDSFPEIRKYILQQANYLKGELRLYLRVVNQYGKVFRVFQVGPIVSFGHPDPQVDQDSNLHLIYQNGATSFSYTVFNPDGDLLVRQKYEYANTRPRLRMDQDGHINVVGGMRVVSARDVPAPKTADASRTTNSLPPAAALGNSTSSLGPDTVKR
ncbi:MAG TPA: hypothetical protein VG146_02740 [Verrucomicrobiae bacterium]|nr:hypothetical protein [Verrucomicrobiae bacterium]